MTSTDRRAALRVGTGLVAGGAFAAACSTSGSSTGRSSGPSPGVSSPGSPSGPPRGSAASSSGAVSPGAGRAPKSSQAPAGPLSAPTPRAFPGQPAQITHGPRDRPRVALTFHGQGEPALAEALLAEAERHGARVTVLAVGTWLDQHPGLARRILDGGHDLGNHTHRHLDINAMSEAEARSEIVVCAARLKKLTGSVGTWFRPSRTARASPLVERLARDAGYPHVLSYDVDSLDFTSPGGPAVAATVLREIRGGSVVSLHFGYPDTLAALPAVLDGLAHRGLRAVTTTELLS
ncbi:polysaccharide deacetylase family protein [Streptomyces sp. NPDC049687]|uniref:polysaccharide deacetylase family protein n=1 Tax=Streptomyces sp. NPDC049687 TaxID=3365596 RepID=UPI00378CF152